MEERVHPIPFRTRKLSSPSPMILHNVMWESRPLSTIAPKPLAATSARGFVVYILPFSHFLPRRPFTCQLPSALPHLRLLGLALFFHGLSLTESPYAPLLLCQSLSGAFTQNRLLSAFFFFFFFFFFPLLHSLPLPETLEPPCLQFCLSLSGAFTQNRLFGPDYVKISFLMLTYLSTLRLKN